MLSQSSCTAQNEAETPEGLQEQNALRSGKSDLYDIKPALVDENERTLSPYFFIKSDDPEAEQLPLLSTSADVKIAGVIADVAVTQVYKNSGKKPIEAIYTFPASTRAAVYGMKMTIGERTIVAKIKERQKAREEYEKAKSEGKTASLLEEQRPNVFQMNVANILPGDTIRVELKYTELLVPTDAVYEFVYPSVVGPRYSNRKASDAGERDKWVKTPYLKEGEAPTSEFDIAVEVSTGVPIDDIACVSHKTAVRLEKKSLAEVSLDKSEKFGGNRDYILRYRLAGNQIQSGLLLFEGEKENFFLATVQPPKRVTEKMIPNREYIYIVDVSGSMFGQPIAISKELMKKLLGRLRPTETFNLLLFSGGSKLLSEKSLPATDKNIEKAFYALENEHGGGGTELLRALNRALGLPKKEAGSRTFVVITDGYVSFEVETFETIRKNLNKANLFAVGIGNGVNRFLIEGMARAGSGEPTVLELPGHGGFSLRMTDENQKPKEDSSDIKLEQKVDKFLEYIEFPVLTQLQYKFDDFETYDVEPVSLPDVMAERPVILFGKWRGKAEGKITLSGFTGDGEKYEHSLNVKKFKPSEKNAALRYLWARDRIATLGDYNALSESDERTKEITELGLTYNLLTKYTSFVAIDSEVRNKTGESESVTQPLPLPDGVSDYAVGGGGFGNLMGSGGIGRGVGMGGAGARQMKSLSIAPKISADESEAASPAPELTLAIGKISLNTTERTEADIKKVLEKNLNMLQSCLAQSGGKRGKLTVTLVLNPNGAVVKAVIKKSDVKEKRFELCLLTKMRRMLFGSLSSSEAIQTVEVAFEIK
ncbi:VIT domain-containing protein [Chloroherpeton thalassium]|uniref:VIT domain-containing protein n=1 Tax=Chloroherpeton thalassium TaxID=100716 RepID=UPI001B7FA99A|nr:VIT domain-containing protein [Chloroherpeton thalassium]